MGMAFGLVASIPVARGNAKGPTISPAEIKEGMRGYGLTVFRGTEPEKFDVEVIGVLKNFRPSQELILVKTPHPRLNITKNVKGMSGSPIYLDGRLAGAYAYSWSAFQVEPVAGVTPIAPMLTEMRRAIPPGFWPLEGQAPLPGQKEKPPLPERGKTAFQGAPGQYDLLEHAHQIAEANGTLADPTRPMVPVATPIMLSGMGDRATALARKLFEPLGLEPMQTGGGDGTSPGAPQHYVDGGAVGVHFVRGDVSFMGLGTVTHVEGQKLCAFGHPMMGMGNAAMPTSIGRVLWIFASDQHSSKIGESVRPLGSMVQDRMSAIVVDESKTPPVFPYTVDIRGVDGAPKKTWRMEVAEEKFLSASLVSAVLTNIVEATVSERRDLTWRLHSRVKIRGRQPLDLDDFGVAVGGSPNSDDWVRSRVVRLVGDVLNNPWELTHIESIQSLFTVEFTRDLLRLQGADVLEPVVDAGQEVSVRLHLTTFAGPRKDRVVRLPVPAHLAGREVDLELVPGQDILPEVAAPESLDELLSNATRQSATPKTLVGQIRLPSQGVTYRRHVAKELPNFALDALRPAASDVGPDPFQTFARTEVPMDHYVDGRARIKLKVRPLLR